MCWYIVSHSRPIFQVQRCVKGCVAHTPGWCWSWELARALRAARTSKLGQEPIGSIWFHHLPSHFWFRSSHFLGAFFTPWDDPICDFLKPPEIHGSSLLPVALSHGHNKISALMLRIPCKGLSIPLASLNCDAVTRCQLQGHDAEPTSEQKPPSEETIGIISSRTVPTQIPALHKLESPRKRPNYAGEHI